MSPSLARPLGEALARPIARALSRAEAGGGGGDEFVPSDVAGLVLWLDPSDTTTTFQDAAAATPATVNNAPVRRINDKSGGGKNATGSDDGKRPLLKTAGGLWWLEFDGSDDCLASAAIDLSGTTKVTMIAAVELPMAAGTTVAFEFSPNYNSLGFITYLDSADQTHFGVNTGGGANVATFNELQGSALVVTCAFDVDINTDPGDQFEGAVRKDGVLLVPAGAPARNNNTLPLPNDQLFIGGRNDASLFTAVKLYGLCLFSGLLSDSDREAVEAFLAAKCGVSI